MRDYNIVLRAVLLLALCALTIAGSCSVTSESGFNRQSSTTGKTGTCSSSTSAYLTVGRPFYNSASTTTLPDGTYYFRVTDSTGKNTLSTTALKDRTCTIKSGVISSYTGTGHQTGTGPCDQTSIQLAPFNTTASNEYQVHLSTDSSFSKNVIATNFSVSSTPEVSNGWLVSYYTSSQVRTTYTPESRFNSPALQTYVTSINFGKDWSIGSGDLKFTRSQWFGATFSAVLTAPSSAEYTFTLTHCQGVRLSIDGKRIVDNWSKDFSSPLTTSGKVTLASGSKYDFLLEYYVGSTDPTLVLKWTIGSASSVLVPSSAFVPADHPFSYQSGGKQYCTLDNTHSDESPITSQKNSREVPDGWSVSSTVDAVVAQSNKWGCDCLVGVDGTTYPTNPSNKGCGKATVTKSSVNSKTRYSCSGSNSKLTYKVMCTKTPTTAPATITDSITPDDTVVYNGVEYALLDGQGINDAGNGDCAGASKFLQVPSGWSIGSSKLEDIPVIALSFGFSGAHGLVVASGNIYSTDSGSVTGFNGLDVNGNYYRAKPSTTCNRVLISRTSTSKNSWDAHNITNYLSCDDLDYDYATLDNTHPLGAGTDFGCPPLALPLPKGWELAKRNSKFEAFISARRITFGSYCLTYNDGTGFLTIARDGDDRVSLCGIGKLRGVDTLSKVSSKRQSVSGAIWTTNSVGGQVNGNLYSSKSSVYLSGGPSGCKGKGLDDGDYYFQVTDPSGKVLLSIDAIENRRVTVSNGEIDTYSGSHGTSNGSCSLLVQLAPFYDSPNNGAEYKVWMTPVGAYDTSKSQNTFGFSNAYSKTDNFKVTNSTTPVNTAAGFFGTTDCSVPRRILIQRTKTTATTTTTTTTTTSTTTAAPVASGTCGTCTSWGDPHITSYWGGKYNFFGVGAFIYVEPTSAAKNWRISGQLTPVKTATCNNAIVFQYDDETVNVSVPATAKQATSLTITRNGASVSDPNAEKGYDIVLSSAKSSQLVVKLPNGISATVAMDYWNINMVTLTLILPNSLKGTTQGLCGTCGDTSFKMSDGTRKANLTGLESQYGNQWRVGNTTVVPFSASYDIECDTPSLTAKAREHCQITQNPTTQTQDYNNCVLDFCNTLETTVNTAATKYAGTDNSLCIVSPEKVTTTFCPVSETVAENVTVFHGREFATLDFKHSGEKTCGSQNDYLSPSDEWKIAEDHPLRRAVVACSRFGTNCLTFAEGTAVSQTLQKCGGVDTNIHAAQDDCWKPLTTGRILIAKKISVDIDDQPDNTGTQKWSYTDNSASKIGKGCNMVTTSTSQKSEALHNMTYGSDAAFSVHAYARCHSSGSKSSSATYGVQVDLEYDDGTKETNVASSSHDFSDNDWNRRWVDVKPKKKCKNIIARYVLSGAVANVTFSDLKIEEGSRWGAGNLLKDPTVQITDTTLSPWTQFKGGWKYSAEDNTVSDSSGSIQLTSASGEKYQTAKDYGALQFMELKNYPEFTNNLTGIYFRGDAKVMSALQGTYGAGFSLYVDVFYEDGQNASYGITAQFSRNTTGWQSAERVAQLRGKPVRAIQFVALFRLTTGSAVFDNLYLTPLYCTFPNSPSDNPPSTYGDPHLVTLDGHAYDVQLLGDFVLLQDDYLSVITRHSRANLAAVNSMTSYVYRGHTITFERNRDTAPPLLTIDRKSVILNPGGTVVLPEGLGTIIASGTLEAPTKSIRYDIDLPTTGHRIIMTANVGDYKVQWLQVYPTLPESSINKTSGLLGVYNFDTSDDFTTSLGIVVPIDSDDLTVNNDFASTWRLTSSGLVNQFDENNLVQESVPDKVYSIEDFNADEIAKAEKACAGIAMYKSCVLDVLLSADAGYANGYNSMESILSSADASKPAQTSINSSTSDNFRVTVIAVVFGILGGLLIVGLIVALYLYFQSRKPNHTGTESINRNLVG